MSTADDFMSKFDQDGRYRDSNGVLDVVFMTSGGNRCPGKLHFSNGLCIRAEMQGSGPWAYPDNSPLNEIRFLLSFAGEPPHAIDVDQGRIVHRRDVADGVTKKDFLTHFKIARNLFVHSPLARAAIWLTPKSFAGFNAADFPELGLDRQMELQTAVQEFLEVAQQVPGNQPPTPEQYRNATVAFQKILTILQPYLPVPDESRRVEKALRGVAFPSWVVNWDYELGSDEEGEPAVWVIVFAEDGAPRSEFGRFALQIIPKIRQAFSTEGVSRWPFVRLRTATEYKTA
jgi:hypothetical protein